MADISVNWPTVGNLGDRVAGLQGDYYRALQQGNEAQLRDAFSNGIPQNPDGTVNFDAVARKILQTGGAPQVGNAVSLLNTGIAQQGATMAPLDFRNADAYVAGAPNTAQPTQLSQSSISQPQAAHLAQPTIGARGDSGTGTMMDYITSKVGPENAGYVAATIKGLDPNAPMPANYGPVADRAIAAWQSKNGQQPAQPVQVAQNGPAPASGAPASADVQSYNRLTQAAAVMRARAAQLAVANPKLAEQYSKAAEGYEGRAKILLEGQIKANEPTPDIKNARASGVATPLDYENQKKSGEAFATQGAKDYEAITKLGAASVPGLQKMELMSSQLNDPSFYSGIGVGLVQKYKQFNAALGNPNAAATVEGFNKEANNVLNDNVKALGGSGVGQVRVAEIKIMQQGNANLGITPWTNRGIVEQNKRIYQDNVNVARMAADYRAQHGNLDSGFTKQVLDYYQSHPLFTQQELSDPKLIGAPVVKPGSPQEMQAQIKAFGLKSGDPLKTVDGRYKYVQ